MKREGRRDQGAAWSPQSDSPSRACPGHAVRALWILPWGLALAWAAACAQPLPDATSSDARAYVQECGGCHAPYSPGLLTAAMWQVQVSRMDEIRRLRGLAPLVGDRRSEILGYLQRHAG